MTEAWKSLCITTNTVEGFFRIMKKGIDGAYDHVSKEHLHPYLTEFDFRYNARGARMWNTGISPSAMSAGSGENTGTQAKKDRKAFRFKK
jgi:hypothetical protein